MKWIEAKVTYDGDQPQLAVELIANAFNEVGLEGVCIEDPTETPDEDWGADALPRPANFAVTGYFPVNEKVDTRRLQLEAFLEVLAAEDGIQTQAAYRLVDEEDWAEAWKAYFWPLKITDRIVVKPTWREYAPESPDEMIIEIDPGMAFGTGTHATTAMCMRLLEKFLKPETTYLDIGTGSGILMVAAARLGAGSGLGVDNDETAVSVARANLDLNRIPEALFKVREGHLTDGIHRRFDVVSANILTHVILVLLDDIHAVLKPDGVFVCSGISEDHGDRVAEKLEAAGFEILTRLKMDEWVAFAGRPRRS